MVTPLSTNLFACVYLCVIADMQLHVSGWDKVMKILLNVRGASNYKQTLFSIQLTD